MRSVPGAVAVATRFVIAMIEPVEASTTRSLRLLLPTSCAWQANRSNLLVMRRWSFSFTLSSIYDPPASRPDVYRRVLCGRRELDRRWWYVARIPATDLV